MLGLEHLQAFLDRQVRRADQHAVRELRARRVPRAVQNAHVMSIAITAVLPEPVAILQPRRRSGRSSGLPVGSTSAASSCRLRRRRRACRRPGASQAAPHRPRTLEASGGEPAGNADLEQVDERLDRFELAEEHAARPVGPRPVGEQISVTAMAPRYPTRATARRPRAGG